MGNPDTFRQARQAGETHSPQKLPNPPKPDAPNLQLELLLLKREKEALAQLNRQLEQKVALKDQQIANHQRQLQLRQKTTRAQDADVKSQLLMLEGELERQHQGEVERLKAEHQHQIQQISQELSSQSHDRAYQADLRDLRDENESLR